MAESQKKKALKEEHPCEPNSSITLISGVVPVPLSPTAQTAPDTAAAREDWGLEVQLGVLLS